MPRLFPAAVLAALTLNYTPAGEPGPLDRALAVQTALADAKDSLTANKPAAAIEILEKNLPLADGSRAYLDVLRAAYTAEVKKQQLRNGDPARVAELRTKLSLLGVSGPGEGGSGSEGEPKPAAAAVPAGEPTAAGSVAPSTPSPFASPVSPTPPAADPPTPIVDKGLAVLREASDLFNQGKGEPRKYGLAARLFAAAFADRVQMTPDQRAAWAFCRVRVAAEQLKRPDLTGPAATDLAAEVEDALKQAPDNAGLQAVGRELLTAARLRAASEELGSRGVGEKDNNPASSPPLPRSPTPPLVSDGWEVVETASFRVRHRGEKQFAEAVAQSAEAKRTDIFVMWSGPPGGAWGPKCDIHLHPDAASFARATNQPAGSTGHAAVNLEKGRPTARRIDLRADDPTAADDALPRELTHVVLADLFPAQAPPRWAVEGMAVLAASPAELDRYLRTAARCRRTGELLSAAALLELTAPPADRVTGFYVGSVALVEFLVRWKGEKAFTTFLRDGQRYGLASALKRQYGVDDARHLEEVWSRGGASNARGQAQ